MFFTCDITQRSVYRISSETEAERATCRISAQIKTARQNQQLVEGALPRTSQPSDTPSASVPARHLTAYDAELAEHDITDLREQAAPI